MINKIKNIKNINKVLAVSFLLSFTLINIADVFATNYNYDVKQEYIKSFGGNSYDYFNSVILTKDDGFIAVGNTSSTNIESITNKGLDDAIIVKYDKDGNQQWVKPFGGNCNDSFKSIIQTNDGGFIVVGNTVSTNIEGLINKGGSDAIIVKYDIEGNQEWVKSFGGNKDDVFESIIQANDNSFISVGYCNSTNIEGITNKGGADAIIVKYDESGNQQWVKSFGGNLADSFNSVVKNEKDSFIVVGDTYSNNISDLNYKGSWDSFVSKYDKDGNQQWIKSFGGNNEDNFNFAISTVDNDIIVVGNTYSTDIADIVNKGKRDAIIIKYDKYGNQKWIKSFGGNSWDQFCSITIDSNGDFIVVGETYSTNIEGISNKGGVDSIVVKYDKDGNQQWIKSFGGSNSDTFSSIVFISNNNFMAIGETYSVDITDIINKGKNDIVLIKYSEIKTIISEQASNNLSLEIITDNSLELSVSTNKISFEGYNGVEDLTNDNLNLTVSSGLYYDLYATLDSEIRGTNDTNAIIDKANLKIKTSDDLEYKSFVNIGEKVNLVANHKNGKDILHNINLKLLKDSSVKADTYQTNITFEAIQK